MSASNKSSRGRNSFYGSKSLTDLPEDVGNRKTFDEIKIPPDDVGNKVEGEAYSMIIHDSLGNSTDEEPSHLRSGILPMLGIHDRSMRRPRARNVEPPLHRKPLPLQTVKIKENANDSVDIMASLSHEFTRLLRARMGMPFAFSMKPVTELVDEELEQNNLVAIEKLINEILTSTAIKATISFSQYRTSLHRFAVYFLAPEERDPVKNKELISALRQVLKLYNTKFEPGQVNVLLVLANARHVIEDHLTKIGAQKVA